MIQHVRATLWLLGMTVLLCSVLYPLTLWGVGQAVCRHNASGSLIDSHGRTTRKTDKAIGSLLIAQPFSGDKYFWPRPSAVSFNASASGGSNWAASNYLLRDRVARQLGPIVKYGAGLKAGQLVGPEIERWFQQDRNAGRPGIVAQWAEAHPAIAQGWVKADKLNQEYVAAWQNQHPDVVALWLERNPEASAPTPEDLAVPFFVAFAQANPGSFPSAVEHESAHGKIDKRIEPVKVGPDIQAYFFDMWRQDNPDIELEKVPADMVMASGSGLDPHITLKNALYQLDRVAVARAKESGQDKEKILHEIWGILDEKTTAPLGGLIGVPMVNVLEINVALDKLELTTKINGKN